MQHSSELVEVEFAVAIRVELPEQPFEPQLAQAGELLALHNGSQLEQRECLALVAVKLDEEPLYGLVDAGMRRSAPTGSKSSIR